MQIQIRTISNEIYMIKIDETKKVYDLKRELRKLNVKNELPNALDLIFDGRHLCDTALLMEIPIQANQFMVVMRKCKPREPGQEVIANSDLKSNEVYLDMLVRMYHMNRIKPAVVHSALNKLEEEGNMPYVVNELRLDLIRLVDLVHSPEFRRIDKPESQRDYGFTDSEKKMVERFVCMGYSRYLVNSAFIALDRNPQNTFEFLKSNFDDIHKHF